MVYRGEDEITPVDNKIDQVWKDVFLFLVTFQDKFYSQSIEQNPSINISEVKITTTDRKRFIENISTAENFSDFEEFAKLINSTKFYKILFNISKDNQAISKINDFLNIVDLSEFYYGKISSQTDFVQIRNCLKYDSSALNDLKTYFYEGGFLSKVGVKQNYLDNEEFLSNYREQMVGKLCPYCGERMRAVDLDHFLPKSQYPLLSIYSSNLVPSCVECNKEKKEQIELPISHPFKFNHLDHIKFTFQGHTAIAVPDVEDGEDCKILIQNMLTTTNFNRLFKEKIIASDLRQIDQFLSECTNDSEEISKFFKFQIISKVKKKLYKDYVQNCFGSDMLQDYLNFEV